MKSNREKKKVIGRQLPTRRGITCGVDNPASMGCIFYELEGGELATVFTPGELHEGHLGMMQGGLISAVLDETLARAAMHNEGKAMTEGLFKCVTSELTVKFRKPVTTGCKMVAYGQVDKDTGVCVFASGYIVDETDEILATASGKFIKVTNLSESLTKDEEYLANRMILTDKDPKVLQKSKIIC